MTPLAFRSARRLAFERLDLWRLYRELRGEGARASDALQAARGLQLAESEGWWLSVERDADAEAVERQAPLYLLTLRSPDDDGSGYPLEALGAVDLPEGAEGAYDARGSSLGAYGRSHFADLAAQAGARLAREAAAKLAEVEQAIARALDDFDEPSALTLPAYLLLAETNEALGAVRANLERRARS